MEENNQTYGYSYANTYSNSQDEQLNDTKKKLKYSRVLNIVLGVLLTIFVVLFVGISVLIYGVYNNIKPHLRGLLGKNFNIASISQISKDNVLNLDEFTTKLAFIDDVVSLLYYYDKDNKKIQDEMFNGYVKALGDKYAEYFPAKEFEEFTEKTTEGVYYGIGCVVSFDRKTDDCKVDSVYEDSPAEKAGIKAGDVFVSIDGENVRGLTLEEITSKIKGPEGTKREIVVYRKSEDKNVEITAYTGKVDIKLITTDIYEGNIGYIDIAEFTGKASQQFKDAVDKLLDQKVEGLIIDCRGNPGGELITVCEMIDYLVKDRDGRYTLNQEEQVFDLGKTLIVYIKEKDKIVDASYAEDNHAVELPIVVLTDYSTASAAELFTETLRDYKKAKVVGIKTYGKGVVQNIIPYDDGSAIKFTVSEYFPPSGYSIDQNGIIPDYSLDYGGTEVEYDEKNHIVFNEEDRVVVFDRDGSILEERKIVKATVSEATLSETEKEHEENLKIYDENNAFLDEEWYFELDEKYEDKQILQSVIVVQDMMKK